MKMNAVIYCIILASCFLSPSIAQMRDLKAGDSVGPYVVTTDTNSENALVLLYKGESYYPSKGISSNKIYAIKQLNNNPDLLIATEKYGTALVRIQQDVPLATFVALDGGRCINLGIVQPDNADILLFPAAHHAVVVSKGKMIWIRNDMSYNDARLVSVSPDLQSVALLSYNKLLIAQARGELHARINLTQAEQDTLWQKIQQNNKEKTPCNYTEKPTRDAHISWFNRHFVWKKQRNKWQLVRKAPN